MRQQFLLRLVLYKLLQMRSLQGETAGHPLARKDINTLLGLEAAYLARGSVYGSEEVPFNRLEATLYRYYQFLESQVEARLKQERNASFTAWAAEAWTLPSGRPRQDIP